MACHTRTTRDRVCPTTLHASRQAADDTRRDTVGGKRAAETRYRRVEGNKAAEIRNLKSVRVAHRRVFRDTGNNTKRNGALPMRC